jgi:hypothetical protein
MMTALQVFFEDDGIVVEGVAGREEESHGTFRPLAIKQRDGFSLMFQFIVVALPELGPLGGIVGEPRPKPGARRDVLEPQVDGGGGLLQAARPQTIDQHAKSILGARRFVDSFDANQRPTGRASVANGWYW